MPRKKLDRPRKQKTHKGLTKRIRISPNGKVKFGKVGKGHLLSHKSANRKRKLNRIGVLAKEETAKIRRLMGHR
jgi:large subunit ribosomal protein L35